MEERIIRLPELITYHQINEVWEESIACFCTKSDMRNISKIPPVLADMFSFIVVEEGMAHYILNYKEYNVQKGDMLLFSPSMLVSLTGCTDDFGCMNLMCERSLFEHMLSSNPAFQTYSYYFCRTDTPVVQLKQEMQTAILKCMEQIRLAIITRNTYQKEIIQSLVYTCMLLVLEVIEERVSSLPVSLGRTERLFHDFMALVVAHYKREHYINFYASRLSVTTTYLSRIIRRQTGKTAAYFLGGMLYAEACRLLTRTDYTAQQIAEELNFSDQSAFGKFFKSKAGVSPHIFRLKGVNR
ncbi:AraC family transcriptional regulator [Phocaeicola coprocola]